MYIHATKNCLINRNMYYTLLNTTKILVKCTFILPCIVIDLFLNNQPDALIIQIYSVIKVYRF